MSVRIASESEVGQLHSRADSLLAQFKLGGDSRYVDEAIGIARHVVKLCPAGHPGRAASLTTLALYLCGFGTPEDLEEAVVLGRETLMLFPSGHPERATALNNLGLCLSNRYEQLGAPEDLDEAVVLTREALLLFPPGDPKRSALLNHLEYYLFIRYGDLGALEDLDEAIMFAREALLLFPSGDPDRSISLGNLGSYLFARYKELGVLEDLNEAVTLCREALLLLPSGDPGRPIVLNKLGRHLSTRFDWLGTLEDLDEAATHFREAILLLPHGNPERPQCLINLAGNFYNLYKVFGGVGHLDDAVTLARSAIPLLPLADPEHPVVLSNLGLYLATRYNLLSLPEDIDQAVMLGREALLLLSLGHVDRPTTLHNLALHLSIRYRRLGVLEDHDEPISLSREALRLLSSGRPERPLLLTNLAGRLYDRYNRLNALEDLNEAASLALEALLICPQANPDRPHILDVLGLCLADRHKRLGELGDLDDAIEHYCEAVLLCSRGHPRRPHALNALADLYRIRWLKLHEIVDLEKMFVLYSQLADVLQITSLDDLPNAKAWIITAEHFQHSSILLAYQTVLRLLVQHLATFPPLPQHLPIVKELTSSLAVDAFSACLRNQSPTKAVELLEHGRGVFWNQLIRLNSSLDDVIACGSEGKRLADKFTQVSSLIRTALSSSGSEQHNRVCSLTIDLQEVIAEIRQMPGLSHFLTPPLFSDLRQAASDGPVIVVNASKYSCDALIVFVDRDPVHVPLHAVTKKDVQGMSSTLRTLTLRAKREDVSKELKILLRKLWDDVTSHIVDVLQTIQPLRTRIWWCPTAEFTLLPLHASGPFRTGQKNLPALYISSYTPTLNALIRARRVVTQRPKKAIDQSARHSVGAKRINLGRIINGLAKFKRIIRTKREAVPNAQRPMKSIVAIGQANPAGQSELLSVDAELDTLGRIVDGIVAFKRIEGPESCISRVVEELGQNEWAHFACHGVPNRQQPFKSAFVLHDGGLSIERIIQCELENPEFAYLSACHTTVGDKESPDEVIHLAAAMQFVGFRSVIGTMWAVDDSEAGKITSTFYKHLWGDSESGYILDYTRAAFALNRTMRELKDIPFDQRILYIHLGA